MSLCDIKYRVGRLISVDADDFDIQVSHLCFQNKVVLDDEYLEHLKEQLPLNYIDTLYGDILSISSRQNCGSSGKCIEKAILDDCGLESQFEYNPIDNNNTAPKEVSIPQSLDNEPEYIEKMLVTTSDDEEEEEMNLCSSTGMDCLPNVKQSIHINQTNLLSSTDDIKRDICHPDTTFPSNENELYIIDDPDSQAQVTLQSVVEAVVRQPSNIGSIPEESLYTIGNEENSDYSILYSQEQIPQDMPSMRLSTSLQFVNDVQPFQKTQHYMDNSDACLDKNLASYVMRIQGCKTVADKGKSILPRLKLPAAYISPSRQQKLSTYLMVAAIREVKDNNKRVFYTCNDLQFLPNNTDKETDALNPIKLNLCSLPIESDGTFELSLRLINMSKKSTRDQTKDKLFHELDEGIAIELHSTPYNSQFFRLGCILVKNNEIEWNTLCLSDYIRPKQRLQT